MKPKRTIVITAPYFPPHGGGLERYTYEIATRLHNDYEWRIVVIASGEHNGTATVETMNGVIVHRLPYRWKLSNTPFSFEWFGQIKKILKEEDPRIVNIQMPVPGIGDVAALVAGKTPIIVTYHAGSMMKKSSLPNIIIWLYEKMPLKILLHRANEIICSSDFVRDNFLRAYRGKSVTITPGVDVGLFKPSTKRDPSGHTVLFVAGLGHAEQHKGLPVLIKAVKALQDKIPDIHLRIVGDGDMRQEYEDRIKAIGLDEVTIFSGRLSGQPLADAYEESDLLVLPSLAPAESFGMVLIEAMSTGAPVIGSNVGGIPNVIDDGKNGILVPSNDVQALANAIERIFSDPELRKRFRENALLKVKNHFLWDDQAKKYDAVLTELR